MKANFDNNGNHTEAEVKGVGIFAILITVILTLAIIKGPQIIDSVKKSTTVTKITFERSPVDSEATVTETTQVTTETTDVTTTPQICDNVIREVDGMFEYGTTTTSIITTPVTTKDKPPLTIEVLDVSGSSAIYYITWLETTSSEQIQIIGINEYRNLGEQQYYHFKTYDGQEMTVPATQCILHMEDWFNDRKSN